MRTSELIQVLSGQHIVSVLSKLLHLELGEGQGHACQLTAAY